MERHAKNIVIPEKIMHAMQIRKMYPEANLNELCLECKNEFGEDISKIWNEASLSRSEADGFRIKGGIGCLKNRNYKLIILIVCMFLGGSIKKVNVHD